MKIDLKKTAVGALADTFETMNKEERDKVMRAYRRARSRTLALYGKDAVAKLANDFRLKKAGVKKKRLIQNTKRSRVWVGGNAMPLSRYAKTKQSAGVAVDGWGLIAGAFTLRLKNGGEATFAPETATLPAWAKRSAKPWFARLKNGQRSSRALYKISVASPEHFVARYAPQKDIAGVFETEFFSAYNKEKK